MAAHEVREGLFMVGGLRPGSIRDQVTRAVRIVDELRATGRLGSGRALCVVGGGVAGVAAAMLASRFGADVTLVERNSELFALQTGNKCRYIHPTQYDWPCDHFGQEVTTLAQISPLPLFGGTPYRMAELWSRAVARHQASRAAMRVMLRTEVTRLAVTQGRNGWTMVSTEVGTSQQCIEDYDEVLWAAGGGSEETCIRATNGTTLYEGPPFWRTDHLVRHAFTPGARVLVSGSGDGGLQDYLRATLGLERFDTFTASLDLPERATALLQSAEDRHSRDGSWNTPETPAALHRLTVTTAIHNQAVTLSLASAKVLRALTAALAKRPDVVLIHRGRHPTAYYALNRFLVALLSRFIHDSTGIETVFPNTEIADVLHTSGRGGPPSGSVPPWTQALGQWHKVTFNRPVCGSMTGHFNAILVRHGPSHLTGSHSIQPHPIANPVQLLPYGV